MKRTDLLSAFLGVIFMAFLAAAHADEAQPQNAGQKSIPAYIPGLGDMMGAIQTRHSKLWFAGINGNWPLAAYELDELKEGLDDAAEYNPEFKNIQVKSLLSQFVAKPLSDLDASIKSKSPDAFKKSFDLLSAACNGCHAAAGRAFISIKRPTIDPVTNQRFLPPADR